ncbi:hypothetical protein L7F22_029324 [Adiantum nelumboides]|nr:hypothetical protein [Adiantum nelumboides]
MQRAEISRKGVFRRFQSDMRSPSGKRRNQQKVKQHTLEFSPKLTVMRASKGKLKGARVNFISPELASKLESRAEEMGMMSEAGLACPSHSEFVTPILGKLCLHIQSYVDAEEFHIMPLQDCDVLPCYTFEQDFDGRKMVNEYVRVCLIGSGSYGKVVLHRSQLDGRLYAMKVLRKSRLRKIRVAPSQSALTDVMREVDIMTHLQHPRIVNLFEVIDEPESDHFYMVLEYVEGGGVFEGPGPRGGIGEVRAQLYFRDAVEGLVYLHKKNVVHGDMKPENLLVTSEGRIKIGDFSISQRLENNNDVIQRSPGTPVFTAPECCKGSPYHGKTADIWALGVALYCMLFGCYPFFGETLQEMYDKVICSCYQIFGKVSLWTANGSLGRVRDEDAKSFISTQLVEKLGFNEYPKGHTFEEVQMVNGSTMPLVRSLRVHVRDFVYTVNFYILELADVMPC